MRHLRLAILGESPCQQCHANCCKQNGHEYAVLLEGHERRRFAAYSVEARFDDGGAPRVERVLPYVRGRCQFLDWNDRCTIYEDRPMNCRRFQCIPSYNQKGLGKHGEFLQRNSDVLSLLETL